MVAPTRHVNALFYLALGCSLAPVVSSGHAGVAREQTILEATGAVRLVPPGRLPQRRTGALPQAAADHSTILIRREDASKDRSTAAWSDTTKVIRHKDASKNVDLPKHPCADHGLLEGPETLGRTTTVDPHIAGTLKGETDPNAPDATNEDPCERLQKILQPASSLPDHVESISEDGNVTEVPDNLQTPESNMDELKKIDFLALFYSAVGLFFVVTILATVGQRLGANSKANALAKMVVKKLTKAEYDAQMKDLIASGASAGAVIKLEAQWAEQQAAAAAPAAGAAAAPAAAVPPAP